MYSCEESRNHDQDISVNEKTFVETRGTHLCGIFLVKPDVTFQDRALGSVIGYIPIFSQYSHCMSLHLKTLNAAKRNQFYSWYLMQKKECLVLLCKDERPCWTCEILVWACEPQQVTLVTVNFPKRGTYYTCI